LFVLGKPFQPSKMFVGKTRTYRVKYLSGAPLSGRLLVLLARIRQDWKGLPGKTA